MQSLPILTSVCQERIKKNKYATKEVIRKVYPMPLTLENLSEFWKKAGKLRNVFNVDVNQNFNTFLNVFTRMEGETIIPNGFFWQVDDMVGVYYITDITLYDCLAHFMFFDQKLYGREEMTKDMLRYLFTKYNFRRISVEIPKYATDHPSNFIKRIGFRREGMRRKAAFYNGEWFDVNCYGILPEEIL